MSIVSLMFRIKNYHVLRMAQYSAVDIELVRASISNSESKTLLQEPEIAIEYVYQLIHSAEIPNPKDSQCQKPFALYCTCNDFLVSYEYSLHIDFWDYKSRPCFELFFELDDLEWSGRSFRLVLMDYLKFSGLPACFYRIWYSIPDSPLSAL